MKQQSAVHAVDRKKVMAIWALYIISAAIVILGASFGIFSLISNVSLMAMNSPIHGAFFGLVIAFLGARYFLSVQKLKLEVYKDASKFSWNNFKKKKV